MPDIQVHWQVQVSRRLMADFTEMLQIYATHIDPGDSLKEIRIIADNALAETIQSLTGQPYQAGSHVPEGVAIPIEKEGDFSSVILIRKTVFKMDQEAMLQQRLTLLEELYHCHLYHQTWRRRGYLHTYFDEPYTNDLFTWCGMLHDEYAVARLKNTFLGKYPLLCDAQGQPILCFSEYGASLSASLEQAAHLVRNPDLLQLPLSTRKTALLPIAYRYIFEPLARQAGFLAPILLGYQLRAPNNTPKKNSFYRGMIAPYWQTVKKALEVSFASEFIKTEEALQAISETIDACLERLVDN